MMVKRKYQYILIAALRSLSNKLFIDGKTSLLCLENNFNQFIMEFSKLEQFKIFIQDEEIFEKFLISNDKLENIMY